jgi:transcription antitermination factor NusG
MFVQHTPGTSWRSLRGAFGVQALITVAGRLEYVVVGSVEALQATEQLRQSINGQAQLFHPGSACRLIGGPFRGHDAVVVEIDGESAVVSVMMFGELRSVAMSLESLSPRED